MVNATKFAASLSSRGQGQVSILWRQSVHLFWCRKIKTLYYFFRWKEKCFNFYLLILYSDIVYTHIYILRYIPTNFIILYCIFILFFFLLCWCWVVRCVKTKVMLNSSLKFNVDNTKSRRIITLSEFNIPDIDCGYWYYIYMCIHTYDS